MKNDRGATLLLFAVSLMMLMILTGFVLDQGYLWAARRQAQNAADAAALAAGTGLLYDAYGDRSSSGPAHQSGVQTASLNLVMGTAPGALVEQSLDAAGWTPGAPQTCLDAPGSCAQASVFRDGTNGSVILPTYFSGFFGPTTQKVRATATVQMLAANGTKCLKPWFAVDKSDVDTFGLADIGTVIPLRFSRGPSDHHQIDIRGSGGVCTGGGTNCYRDAIEHCSNKTDGTAWEIGDVAQEKPGNSTGGQVAMQAIYNQDPNAAWDSVNQRVINSCAASGTCACATNQTCANGLDGRISPRIITIALFKPAALAGVNAPGGNGSAPISSFGGVFMLRPGTGPLADCTADPDNICGHLMPAPGTIGAGATPAQGQTLNVQLSLIR